MSVTTVVEAGDVVSGPGEAEVLDRMRLAAVPGLSPRLVPRLIQRFGSAGSVLRAKAEAPAARTERIDNLVTSGHHESMTTVRIAELKAGLSAHLRAVRDGETIEILDRDTPIARIVPLDLEPGALTIRRPRRGAPRLADVPIPGAVKLRRDPVALLLEDREGGR